MSSSANHIWRCWMNRLNEGKKAEEWDHSIYLWKDALEFAEYGHDRIKQAFDGTLPQTHQQCSFSAPERIEQNTLRCCLEQEVTTCPMLLQIKAVHEEHWNRPVVECSGYDPGKYYREEVSHEDMHRTMAKTCAWHVYEESKNRFVDASEGFHLDESDRRFWSRVYESMSATDSEGRVLTGADFGADCAEVNIGDVSFRFTAKVELNPEWAARFKQPPNVELSFDVDGSVPPEVAIATKVEILGVDGVRFEQDGPAEPEYDATGKLVRIRAAGRFIEAGKEEG